MFNRIRWTGSCKYDYHVGQDSNFYKRDCHVAQNSLLSIMKRNVNF